MLINYITNATEGSMMSNNSNSNNNNMPNTTVDVDNIIKRLLDGKLFWTLCLIAGSLTYHFCSTLVKSARPGKRVNLLESEIAYLCQKSRQVFLSQPVLLELEAPIKVCGNKTRAIMLTGFLYFLI